MISLSTTNKSYHQLDAIKPFNVRYARYRQPSGNFYIDSHYDLQIGIVPRGCEEIEYVNYYLRAGPGQVWLTSCWEPHAARITKPNTCRIVVTISPESIGRAAPFGEVDWLAPFFTAPAARPIVDAPGFRRQIIMIGEAIGQIGK